MKKELENQIIDKAPWLFVLMDREKTTKERHCYYPISYGFECDSGWFDILDRFFNKIAQIDKNKELNVFQVKEKFGGLRIYFDTIPKHLWDVVNELTHGAEKESFKTCERCGKPGKIRKGSWLKVLCDECNCK